MQHLVQGFLLPFRVAIYRLRSLIQPVLKEMRQPLVSVGMEGITARQAFLQRCLKLLTNALRWRKYAQDPLRLPAAADPKSAEGCGAGLSWTEALSRELVEKTLLPVAEAGWETGGAEVAQKVGRVESGWPGLAWPGLICSVGMEC